jgi:hypothetical protein
MFKIVQLYRAMIPDNIRFFRAETTNQVAA